MTAIEDRVALEELMNRYAAGIDRRQWAEVRAVFADEIEADFTAIGSRSVFRGQADQWVETIRATIIGFDATQHFFANHSVELDGDMAKDLRYMQARHMLGGAHYTIGGWYEGEMRRGPEGWRIRRYKLSVAFTDGDRRLMGVAYRRFKSS